MTHDKIPTIPTKILVVDKEEIDKRKIKNLGTRRLMLIIIATISLFIGCLVIPFS